MALFVIRVLSLIPLLFLLSFAAGCASKTSEEQREEGHKVIERLVVDLQEINSRQELLKALPKLTKRYVELVNAIMAIQETSRSLSADLDEQVNHKEQSLSDKLRAELNRIYKIEGAREIMEKCQEEALYHLDAYEKRKNK